MQWYIQLAQKHGNDGPMDPFQKENSPVYKEWQQRNRSLQKQRYQFKCTTIRLKLKLLELMKPMESTEVKDNTD